MPNLVSSVTLEPQEKKFYKFTIPDGTDLNNNLYISASSPLNDPY